MAGRVGIRDIARMAGVSPGTVSKVLKNYSGISDQTRRKVMEVVEETGFIPNSVASALSSKQNNRIALFIYVNDRSQQIDEINMLYILGAFEKAREENLELITVFNASIEKLSPEDTVRYFHSLYVDTVIVFGLNKKDEKIRYLSETGNMKIVAVDACITGEYVSTVMIDHTKGQYEVAAEICNEGDSVLYLKGRDDGFVTDMRLNGMKQLAEDRHLKLDVVSGDFSEKRAYDIVRGLEKEYDAIVCASDLMAIGAKHALPKGAKTKISGFDGIRLMEYAANDVITCRQDFHHIGSVAAEAAERLLKGGEGEVITVPHSVTRIVRPDHK